LILAIHCHSEAHRWLQEHNTELPGSQCPLMEGWTMYKRVNWQAQHCFAAAEKGITNCMMYMLLQWIRCNLKLQACVRIVPRVVRGLSNRTPSGCFSAAVGSDLLQGISPELHSHSGCKNQLVKSAMWHSSHQVMQGTADKLPISRDHVQTSSQRQCHGLVAC
jgi:hypothetical protein